MFQSPYAIPNNGMTANNMYQNYYQQPRQMLPQQTVIKVNGRNGAEAYAIAPNSSVILLDEQNPVVWLKTTDGAGYPTITPYAISPFEEKKQVDTASLEERISRLEKMINESNDTDVKRKKSTDKSD